MRVYIIVLLILGVAFSSCRKKPKPAGGWNTEVLAPLMKGELALEDIITDTLLAANPDNSMKLVYRSTFYNLNLAEEGISVPDTSLSVKVTLDSIKLPDRSIVYNYSLGQFAKEDPTYGPAILIAATLGIPVEIPAIDSTGVFDQPLDATAFFETATLDSGFLDLTIENGFPIDISELIFRVKNQSNLATVLIDTFYNIPKGGQEMDSYSLAGQTVDGNLLIDIIKLSSPGTTPDSIIVDTSDAIILTATVRDLKVLAATAIFPAQNLVNERSEIVYDMGGPEFTSMKIRSGRLRIEAVNTIEDSLHLQYTIPGAIDSNNQVILVNSAAPPAPTGGSTNVTQEFDLTGVTIDLTGLNRDKVNTFYNEFTARIDSSGNLISISLTDSILVSYSLLDIIPQYVKGYLGQHQIATGTVTEPNALFKNVVGGTVDLEQADVTFSLLNRMGVEGTATVNSITSINQTSGNNVALSAAALANPLTLQRAFENPDIVGLTTVSLNSSNSNIDALIENLPTHLEYDLDLSVNPQGNQYNYQDFASYGNTLEASLDLEVPLSVVSSQLTLQDTFDFNFNLSGTTEGVSSASLYFLVDNGFPLDAGVQVYFADATGFVLDSLFSSPSAIAAAELDDATCRATASLRTRLQSSFETARLNLLETATQAIVRIAFTTASTPSCNGPIKIFSDYGMQFKLTGRFNYHTGGPS